MNHGASLRHNCSNGHHRLIAKIVNHKLELACDSCKEKIYLDRSFLRLILNLLDTESDLTIYLGGH